MSRHHKSLTLGALNDTWDEIFKHTRALEERIKKERDVAINVATRKAHDEIERAKVDLDKRMNREINNLEGRVNGRLVDLERRHNERLQQVTKQMYEDMNRGFENMNRAIEAEAEFLNGRIDKVQEWTRRNLEIIDKNMREMQEDTNRRFEAQQQQINDLQVSVQDIFDRFKNEATMARDIANEMNQLLQAVCENNPVHIYAPGELRDIREHINSLINSNYPAASVIAVADNIIHDILRMKEKTVLAKARHDEMLMQTRTRLQAILAVIAANTNQPLEHDGETATIVTDFWTNGQYSQTLEKLRKIEAQLADEELKDQLTTEQIADLLKEAERLNLEGVALMQRAVNRALKSQERAEVTLDIVNALIRQGYEVKSENGEDDFDYMGGEVASDQREGVFAILRNPATGEEINVTLRPNPNEETNDLDIQLDNSRQPVTEQQLRVNIERIREEMKKSGYDVGPIQVPTDGGNEIIPEMQSGQQLRRAGATERLRKAMA